MKAKLGLNPAKSKLFRKAIIAYVILAIIPSFFITAFTMIVFTKNRNEQTHYLIDQNAIQNETIIQDRKTLYENLFFNLISDSSFISLAKTINSENQSYSTDRINVTNKLESYVYSYDGIRAAAFIAENGQSAAYSKWYGSQGELTLTNSDVSETLLSKFDSAQGLTYYAMVDIHRASDAVDYTIIMGMPVRDLHTKKVYGVLVFSLAESEFTFTSGTAGSYGIQSLMTDNADKILTGVSHEYTNKQLSDYLQEEYDSRNIDVRERKISNSDWKIVNIIDKRAEILDNIKVIVLVVAIMLLITALFFIIVWRYVYQYISEIQRIAERIENFDADSNKEIPIQVDENDELYMIDSGFNRMAEHNNALVETLKKRNDEIREAEDIRRHAEIKALEAQINPHFIYNTLDTINWMAIDKDEEEISNMLGTLGSLLRYSVSNIDILVLMRAEIEWLQKYTFLQKERFHNSFDCSFDVSEEAMDFPVYKMLLQPIVENSIIHAFEDMSGGGLINITAYVRPDGKLSVEVRDNGKGMSEEVLEKERNEILYGEGLNCRDIGISNIIQRLHIYYQNEASMNIESVQNKGTTVTLIVPYRNMIYKE